MQYKTQALLLGGIYRIFGLKIYCSILFDTLLSVGLLSYNMKKGCSEFTIRSPFHFLISSNNFQLNEGKVTGSGLVDRQTDFCA